MGNKPTGLAWNLPPSQRPFRPVPAISPTPVSVPLPFIVIAHGAMGARPRGDGRSPTVRWALTHGAMGARPWGGGRSPMGRWAFAHGAVGDGNLRNRNVNQGRGNANQGPRITNQGRKTEGEG